jgi:hypothetical protein
MRERGPSNNSSRKAEEAARGPEGWRRWRLGWPLVANTPPLLQDDGGNDQVHGKSAMVGRGCRKGRNLAWEEEGMEIGT